MSADPRPQYKPTPELQTVLNTLSPKLCETLTIPNQNFNLLSYSKYTEDPNRFTLYIEGAQKRYKMELQQELGPDRKYHMKVLQMFEIVTK